MYNKNILAANQNGETAQKVSNGDFQLDFSALETNEIQDSAMSKIINNAKQNITCAATNDNNPNGDDDGGNSPSALPANIKDTENEPEQASNSCIDIDKVSSKTGKLAFSQIEANNFTKNYSYSIAVEDLGIDFADLDTGDFCLALKDKYTGLADDFKRNYHMHPLTNDRGLEIPAEYSFIINGRKVICKQVKLDSKGEIDWWWLNETLRTIKNMIEVSDRPEETKITSVIFGSPGLKDIYSPGSSYKDYHLGDADIFYR